MEAKDLLRDKQTVYDYVRLVGCTDEQADAISTAWVEQLATFANAILVDLNALEQNRQATEIKFHELVNDIEGLKAQEYEKGWRAGYEQGVEDAFREDRPLTGGVAAPTPPVEGFIA